MDVKNISIANNIQKMCYDFEKNTQTFDVELDIHVELDDKNEFKYKSFWDIVMKDNEIIDIDNWDTKPVDEYGEVLEEIDADLQKYEEDFIDENVLPTLKKFAVNDKVDLKN